MPTTPTDQPAAGAITEPRSHPARDADVPIAPEPAREAPARAPRLVRLARRHALFLLVATIALVLRGLVVAAYRPALMYLGDSAAYLDQAWHGLWPGNWRPSGYSMFLLLVGGEEHLTRLVVLQQALTFLLGVATYLVAARVTRRPWTAALCAAPALLAPWVLDLGQFVLAETLFTALVTGGLLLLAAGPLRLWNAPLAGLLLGASLPVRTVGYGPLAVGAAVLVATVTAAAARSRRSGAATRKAAAGRACALTLAFAIGAAAPVCAYAGWSASEGRGFAVSAHSGYFLYGRVAPFADCAELPAGRPDLRSLCDPRPVDERTQPDSYLWPANSLLRQGDKDIPRGREDLAGEFAGIIERAQPWMLVRTSASYLAGYFSPLRYEGLKTSRADSWELPDAATNVLPDRDPRSTDGYYITTTLDSDLARPLAAYSRLQYAPMPLVAVGLLAGLAATVVAWRRHRPGPPRLFWLAGGSGLSVLALSALTSGFDYRYLASVIGLLGTAAVLGVVSLVRGLRQG